MWGLALGRNPLLGNPSRTRGLMSQIEFHQVSKRFENGHEALRDITAAFEAGSMTFLTGHSGAGKSTFLKLLLCLDRPTRGQILVNGVNVTQIPPVRLAHYRQNLGAVFQDHHLLTHRTVFENVALPLRVAGLKEKDIGKRVRAALSRLRKAGYEISAETPRRGGNRRYRITGRPAGEAG